MGISFGSISTGLPKDIVKQIISAEKIPLTKMEERKSDVVEKKKLVGELISIVTRLKDFLNSNDSSQGLREVNLNYDNDAVDISADKNVAKSGSHQFEVISLAQKSSAMTSGFSDPDANVGVGFIQYTLPDGEVKDVYVDSSNNTLKGVAKIINQDKDNDMSANIVNDGSGTDSPWRIIVSLDETGDETMADFPYLYFVDGENDFYVEYEREAQDAVVKLEGFEIELPENKTSDLIPGLSIDLLKAKPGEEFTITVGEDIDAIGEKVKGFLDTINEVLKFIIDQNSLDENSNTRRTLGGDITLQTLESKIRGFVFKEIKTNYGSMRLGDVGITFNKSGMLDFDPSKFESTLKKNFNQSMEFFAGGWDENEKRFDGIFKELQGTVTGILRFPTGILPNRKKGLESTIDQMDRRISNKQRMIDKKEQTLKDKFARLEGTINRIKSQGAGLAALGGAPDPVTQLG